MFLQFFTSLRDAQVPVTLREYLTLMEALDANRRLWNVLSADCAAPENKLPMTLRGQIISLAMWVARYSSEVLRDGADVEPLIDINRTMMEGLGAR